MYQTKSSNIAKGTTDPRVEFISQVQTRILIKFHPKNLDFKISTKHRPLHKTCSNICSFRISTKIQLHDLYKTSAEKTPAANLAWTSTSKSWPNLPSEYRPRFNFITSTKHQQKKTPAANLAWTSTSKSWPNLLLWTKSLAFWPNLSFEICNKLLPTQSSSATVTTWTSFELASSHDRGVTSVKFTKQQWVSEWVTRVNNDRTRVR